MFYLIHNGFVVDKKSSIHEVHPTLTWVESTDDTHKVGTAYDTASDTFATPTLAEVKANKLIELDNQYAGKAVRTVIYDGKIVIVNDASLNGIQSKITLIENNTITNVNWYFDDGNTSSLTLDNLKELQILIANQDQLLRDIKYEHQQAIQGFTDVTSIDAYDVTGDIETLSWSK